MVSYDCRWRFSLLFSRFGLRTKYTSTFGTFESLPIEAKVRMGENDAQDRERLEKLRDKMAAHQLTEEDKDEAGGFDDSQEALFDLDPEEEEFDEIDKAYRREKLEWASQAARILPGAYRSPE